MITIEEKRIENFKTGHVCPDREVHDHIKFDTITSRSYASAIGTNTYITCVRCKTQQDVTAYEDW